MTVEIQRISGNESCPCGSGAGWDACCGPIVAGDMPAATAEALMRSRYSAFSLGEYVYIDRTQAKSTGDGSAARAAESSAAAAEWIGLEVLGTSGGGSGDDTGTVEFAARYRADGVVRVLRENSRFRRENGVWIYGDGDVADEAVVGADRKVGRNSPCPCGSRKKFKKCCGA